MLVSPPSSGSNSVYIDTWTQHSVKEIDRLTSIGGFDNNIKAMGQAAILGGASLGDAIYFSLEAAKAMASLDMALMVVRINLAVRHGIQAGLAFPAIIVPRLALTTTEWLSIKGQDLPSNWIDRARDLARRIGADLQSNPRAILALKLGGALTTLGLAGLIVYLNTSSKKGMAPVQKPLEHALKTILGVASFVFILGFGFGLRKNRIAQNPPTPSFIQKEPKIGTKQVQVLSTQQEPDPQGTAVSAPTSVVQDVMLEGKRGVGLIGLAKNDSATCGDNLEHVKKEPDPTSTQDKRQQRGRRVERSLALVQRYLATCAANLKYLNSQVTTTTSTEQEVERSQENIRDEEFKWERRMVAIRYSPQLLKSYIEQSKVLLEKLNGTKFSYTLGPGCEQPHYEVDVLQPDKTIQDHLALCDEAEIIADTTIQLTQEILKR